jgi:hypothetical protein
MSRKAATVSLASVGAVAAFLLSGGLYAASIITIEDRSSSLAGVVEVDPACDDYFSIRSGPLNFDSEYKSFVLNNIIIEDVAGACAGLYATVVGTDGEGNPVAEGSGIFDDSGSLNMTLAYPVSPNVVSFWNIAAQRWDTYAGAGLSGPVIVPFGVLAEKLEEPNIEEEEPVKEEPIKEKPVEEEPENGLNDLGDREQFQDENGVVDEGNTNGEDGTDADAGTVSEEGVEVDSSAGEIVEDIGGEILQQNNNLDNLNDI